MGGGRLEQRVRQLVAGDGRLPELVQLPGGDGPLPRARRASVPAVRGAAGGGRRMRPRHAARVGVGRVRALGRDGAPRGGSGRRQHAVPVRRGVGCERGAVLRGRGERAAAIAAAFPAAAIAATFAASAVASTAVSAAAEPSAAVSAAIASAAVATATVATALAASVAASVATAAEPAAAIATAVAATSAASDAMAAAAAAVMAAAAAVGEEVEVAAGARAAARVWSWRRWAASPRYSSASQRAGPNP